MGCSGARISAGSGIGGCTKLLAWSPSGNNIAIEWPAAEMLRAAIAAHRFGPEARLQVITHSHGGNVALAASRLGLARGIDCLITLNKPQMDSEMYRPGENIGRLSNISTVGWDWLQFWGSAAKRHYKTDPRAVNKVFDTFRSKLKPLMRRWFGMTRSGRLVAVGLGAAQSLDGTSLWVTPACFKSMIK